MLLFIMVTSCSKGDDNTVDPDTTPTAKLPTLRLTTSPKDAFVNEDIAFKVVDEKGKNVVIDAKLFVNEQALNATTFSSKTAASFKVYAQKAGFKTSNTVEVRFMDKEDVDVVVTGKWKFIPSTVETIFKFKKDMNFTYRKSWRRKIRIWENIIRYCTLLMKCVITVCTIQAHYFLRISTQQSSITLKYRAIPIERLLEPYI